MKCLAQSSPRRGVAMLLVIISLMLATILTAAYLASRDNSTAIGENVASSAAARWAAVTGIETGVAIMETETDWRTTHNNGVLLNDYGIGDGTIDLALEDLETGQPPNESTTNLKLISTATAGGVIQTATAYAKVPPPDSDGDSINVDLSEFAVFSADNIEMRDDATLARWTAAPMSSRGRRVLMGTRSANSSTIEVKERAAAMDTTVYHGPNVSGAFLDVDNGPAVTDEGLLDDIPLPDPPDSGVDSPDRTSNSPQRYWDEGSRSYTRDARLKSLLLDDADLILEDMTLTVEDSLRLINDAAITIRGDVKIVVFDELRLYEASIEIVDDATLTVFLKHRLDITDSYIGDSYSDGRVPPVDGTATWMDANRVKIYSIRDTSPTNWYMSNNSVIKGSIYAPGPQSFEIGGLSALYGRIVAQSVNLRNNGAIFYDHSLDKGGGFSNPNSPIYDENGNIIDSVLNLGSLNDSDLELLATTEDLVVSVGNLLFGDNSSDEEPEPAPTDPTPRPVPVEYELASFGVDTSQWE